MSFSWAGCSSRSSFSVSLSHSLIAWNIFEASADALILCKRKTVLRLNDLKGNLTIKFESRKRTDITAVLVLVLIACFTNEFDETLMRHHASDINSVFSRYQFLSKFPAIVLM